MQRLFPLVLMVTLLAPSASASPHAVRGEVEADSPPWVEGDVRLTTTRGALDLTEAVRRGESPSLLLSHASGRLVRSSWAIVGDVHTHLDWRADPMDLPAGTLRFVACDPKCLVLLVTDGGTLGVRGDAAGALAWRGTADHRCVSLCGEDHPVRFEHVSPAGSLLAGRAGLRVDGEASASGRVRLVLDGVLAEHVTPEGHARPIDARDETTQAPGGAARRVEKRFAVLTLDAIALDAPAASVEWMAEALDARLAGTLGVARASGQLDLAGRPQRLDAQPLRLTGDLGLAMAVAVDDALLPAPPVARLGVEGSVVEARLADRVVAPVEDARVAAGTLAALVLLALVVLYSRIRKDRIFDNENRARIVALLREHPGLTSREIAARLRVARVVVQHHLIILLTHRFVLRQRVGRADRYHAADAPLDRVALERERTLRDPTRRRIADAVAARAGLTQSDVASVVGVSQRLVSYHLQRLEALGLVRSAGASPRKYEACPGLLELRRAEKGE